MLLVGAEVGSTVTEANVEDLDLPSVRRRQPG
jgi:hypothetical protein